MAEFREEVLEAVAELIGGEPDVSRRKMFGYPAFFAGAKMAVCVHTDGVALRLTEEEAERLAGERLPPFAPGGGRTMNGWTVLEREKVEDLRDDAPLLHAALERARDAA